MYGTLIDRCHRALDAAKTIGYSIKDKNTGMVYKYGDNTYMDMCIENCVFVDRNTDIVENPDDYFGFNRSNWELYTNEGIAGGLEWNGRSTPKDKDQYPHEMKQRWVKEAKKGMRNYKD